VTYKANGQVLTDANPSVAGFQWDTSGYNGQVTLVAEAQDAAGNKGAAQVSVTVDQAVTDTQAPTVSITSPAANVVLKGAVTVAVSATDNVGVAQVQLLDGGKLLDTQSSGVNNVYTFSVDTTKLADGIHILRAVAVDRSGNANEARISVTVDNTAPVVSWVNPVGGAILTTSSATLSVQVLDANLSGSPTFEATGGSISGNIWTLPSLDGTYQLTAIATDKAGNETRASIQVTVDQNAPVITWITPPANDAEQGKVTLQVKAEDTPGVKRVAFLADRGTGWVLLGDAVAVNDVWSYTWDTTSFSNGPVTLRALAVSMGGKEQTSDRVISVANPDTQKPQVEWLDPLDGQVVKGIYTLKVRALDNQRVAKVEFYAGGTLVGTVNTPTGTTWTIPWDSTTVQDDQVTLKARAYDASDNTAEASITVSVRNQGEPPKLDIQSPASNSDVGVQFLTKVSVAQQGTSFTWIPTPPKGMGSGNHNLWVRIYDYRGNIIYERYLTTDGDDTGNEPPPQDSVVERFVDLGSAPADTYRLVVEGSVQVGSKTYSLYKEQPIKVVFNSNLPPALVVYQPKENTFLANNFLIGGRVTDDSGSIHALEVRMIQMMPGSPTDSVCGTSGYKTSANYLLQYNQTYGDFIIDVNVNGQPSIPDGLYCLRVVAIDSADTALRNIQEYKVTVDRTKTEPVPSVSVTKTDVGGPGIGLDPEAATWSVSFPTNGNYTIFLRKNGAIVQIFNGQATSTTFTREFSDADQGNWDVVVIFRDSAGGVQGSILGGSVAVNKN